MRSAVAEVELGRHLGAGLLADEGVEPRGELALGRRAGSAASSASAITRPSTRSPRNSRRWLSAPVASRRVGQRLDQQLRPGEVVAEPGLAPPPSPG